MQRRIFLFALFFLPLLFLPGVRPSHADEPTAPAGEPRKAIRLVLVESYERLPQEKLEAVDETVRTLLRLADRVVQDDADDVLSVELRGEVVSLKRDEHGDLDEERLFVQVAVVGTMTLVTPVGQTSKPLEGKTFMHVPDETTDEEGLRAGYESACLSAGIPSRFAELFVDEEGARARFLGRILTEIQGVWLRQTVLQTLSQMDDPSPALSALHAIYGQDRWLVGDILGLVGRIGSPSSVEVLLEALRTGKGAVKEGAIRALAELEEPRAAEALMSAYLAGDGTYALETSVPRIAQRVLPMLLTSIRSDDPDTQARAAFALGHTYAVEAVEPLLAVLSDARSGARWNAVRALGGLDDARAIAPLREIARTDPQTRRAALFALGTLEAWGAVEEILAGLTDEDSFVRDFAVRALEALSGEALGESAETWRAWWKRTSALEPTGTGQDVPTITVDIPDGGEGVPLVLARIPGGEFRMGGGKRVSWMSTTPEHPVLLRRPYYLGRTEVTQAQYEAVMRVNPSAHVDATHPVEQVTWEDAQRFCRTLSGLTGKTFRLPTEAEWERACRGGSSAPIFYVRDRRTNYAWFVANSGGTTHPVGGKRPNPYGLYDVYGNVAEWCHDWQDDYETGRAVDPRGPESGRLRIVRGGSFRGKKFLSTDRDCERPDHALPDLGFRVLMEAE